MTRLYVICLEFKALPPSNLGMHSMHRFEDRYLDESCLPYLKPFLSNANIFNFLDSSRTCNVFCYSATFTKMCEWVVGWLAE